METRNYQSGDEKKIIELFGQVFKKSLRPEVWKWRFANNPTGKIMIKLMWDGDILAGHYAVSPLMLDAGENKILTALSMTTMTHPDYGGRGIFTDLAEALYQEEYKNSNLQAIWGFPNTNSHYGFIKNLQWKDILQMPFFSLPVARLKPAENPAVLKEIFEFTDEHASMADEFTRAFPVKTDRNKDYLNWRYFKNPEYQYRVLEFSSGANSGYVVTKIIPSFSDKEKSELDLLELMAPNDYNTLRALMTSLLEFFSATEILKINTWLSLYDNRHINLEKLGFDNASPLTYHGIRIMNPGYVQLADARNWFLCMGDSDVF